MDRDLFYDTHKIAFMPMGLCYPGKDPRGGDRPPCKKCAPAWHEPIRSFLPNIQLTLLVGQYAQAYYLKNARKSSMTETVRSFQDYLPTYFPLPHPSWRNTHWIQNNPWFEKEVLACLKKKVFATIHL
jgi:uracil-DNA glycosylase